jgi:hypothetical protein
MELKTKFIEGTNEQYSIREDGVVFKNYNVDINNNKTILKNYIVKPIINSKTLQLRIKNNKIIAIKRLVINAFKPICFLEENKILNSRRIDHKDNDWLNCNINNLYIPAKKTKKELRIQARDLITKSYVATALGIKVKELSNEFYEHYRMTISFKRKLVSTYNVSIRKFN